MVRLLDTQKPSNVLDPSVGLPCISLLKAQLAFPALKHTLPTALYKLKHFLVPHTMRP